MKNISLPQKGMPITLSWGVAVTERCNSMRQMGAGGLVRNGAGGFGQEALPANLRERRINRLLHPYKVQHYFKEENGSEAKTGVWAIYLPAGPICVVNGETYDPSADLTAAGDVLGARWFDIDVIPKEGGTLWLNLTKSESDEKVTLSFSKEASGEHSFAIASVTYSDNTTTIHQYILSAIHSASKSESGSDGITVDSNSIIAISLDYVLRESDPDFAYYPYALRLKRGNLAIKNGVLTVVENPKETQFISTVPYSEIVGDYE